MAATTNTNDTLPSTPRPDLPPDKRPRDRPRAREVSSRYMNSLPPPSPSHNPLPPPPPLPRKHPPKPIPRRSPSVERRPPPSPDFADENCPDPRRVPATLPRRRPASPVHSDATESEPECFGDENRTRRRAVSRLFSDDQKASIRNARPLTPMVQCPERVCSGTPSANQRSNLWGRRASTQVARPVKESLFRVNSAAELFTPARRSSSVSDENKEDDGSIDTSPDGSSLGDFEVSDTCSIGNHGGWCESPPIKVQGSRVRSNTECRSSMPEADRIMGEGAPFRTPSMCNRSLNSALSNCQPSAYAQLKSSVKSSASMKMQQNLGQNQKVVGKTKKAGANRQEDIHVLRLLENRYLQWRFANARAQVVEENRRVAAERSLNGLALKLPELRDSTKAKQIELQKLKSMGSISTVLNAQMPYLDQWNALESEYSDSISGATKALQDACLRLPISGDLKVNLTELDEAIGSAVNVMDALSPRVDAFLPQADGVHEVMAELATVVTTERSLIEQCGALLAELKRLQVTECSLRSHMIQMKQQNSLVQTGSV